VGYPHFRRQSQSTIYIQSFLRVAMVLLQVIFPKWIWWFVATLIVHQQACAQSVEFVFTVQPKQKTVEALGAIEKRLAAQNSIRPVYLASFKSGEIRIRVPDGSPLDKLAPMVSTPGLLVYREIAPDAPAELGPEHLHGKIILDNVRTIEVVQGFDLNNNPSIDIALAPDAAEAWGRYTAKAIGKRVAAILDDEVLIAPTIQAPITGGRMQLAGLESVKDAEQLAERLKATTAPISAPVTFSEQRLVEQARDKPLSAFKALAAVPYDFTKPPPWMRRIEVVSGMGVVVAYRDDQSQEIGVSVAPESYSGKPVAEAVVEAAKSFGQPLKTAPVASQLGKLKAWSVSGKVSRDGKAYAFRVWMADGKKRYIMFGVWLADQGAEPKVISDAARSFVEH
jgi:hypothetical protein